MTNTQETRLWGYGPGRPPTPRTCQYCGRRRKSVFWHRFDEKWYCEDIWACEAFVHDRCVEWDLGLRPKPWGKGA